MSRCDGSIADLGGQGSYDDSVVSELTQHLDSWLNFYFLFFFKEKANWPTSKALEAVDHLTSFLSSREEKHGCFRVAWFSESDELGS